MGAAARSLNWSMLPLSPSRTGAAAIATACKPNTYRVFFGPTAKNQLVFTHPLASGATGSYIARSKPSAPFVYRLGRQVFNLERGVRFP